MRLPRRWTAKDSRDVGGDVLLLAPSRARSERRHVGHRRHRRAVECRCARQQGMAHMKSFLQPGEAMTLTPPADVKRDQVVGIGAFIGIATTDAPKDGKIEVALTRVYELPKAAAAVAQGDLADWDSSKVVAGRRESYVPLGAVVTSAGSEAATCRVRLNGSDPNIVNDDIKSVYFDIANRSSYAKTPRFDRKERRWRRKRRKQRQKR